MVESGAADYVTGHEGGGHAVREAAELLLGLSGLYGKAVSERAAFSDAYGRYLVERQAQTVKLYRSGGGGVVSVEE